MSLIEEPPRGAAAEALSPANVRLVQENARLRTLLAEAGVDANRMDQATSEVTAVLAPDDDERLRVADEALLAREHFLRRMTEATPSIITVFDVKSQRSVFANRSVGRVLGYTNEDIEAMGDKVAPTLMHPDDFARFPAHLERVRGLRDDETAPFEHRMRDRTGAWHWFRSSDATFARDASGAVSQLISAAFEITAEKQAEAELQRANAVIDTLVQTAPLGFCFVDRDLRFIRINARLAEMNGRPVEAHLGRLVSEILPELVDTLREVTDRILVTGNAVMDHEFSGETAALPGVMRVWCEHWYPVRDVAGETIGFGGIVEDITDRRQAQALLRESEARFRAAFENSSLPMSIVSQARTAYVDVNKACTDLFGLSRDAMIGRTPNELQRYADPTARVGLRSALRRDGFVRDHEVLWHVADGQPRWHLISADPVVLNGEACLFVVSHDITDRKLAEVKLAQSELEFRAAFEQSTVGKVQVSAITGRIVRANTRFCEMTGYTFEELSEMTPRDLNFADDRAADAPRLAALLSGASPAYSIEMRYVRKDGEIIWVHVNATLLRDPAGNPDRTMAVVQDITDRKRRERNLGFLAELLAGPPMGSRAADMLQALSKRIAEHLNVSRCAFLEMDEAATFATVLADHFPAGQASVVGTYERAQFNSPEDLRELSAGRALVINDVRNDRPGEAAANYEALGVRAFANAPYLRNGRLKFSLAVGDDHPRQWHRDELEFLGFLAERIYLILERERAEDTLRASEQFSRTVLEASPDCLKVIGADGRLEYVNVNGACLLEVDGPAAILGEPWESLWPTTFGPKIVQSMVAARAGQRVEFTAEAPTAKGTPKRWEVSVTAIPGPDGQPVKLLAASRDVTEKMRSQLALIESETRYRGTFENAAVGVAHVALDGSWLDINNKLIEIVGYSRDELLTRTFQDLTHPDDLDADLAQLGQVLRGEISTYAMDKRYIRKDGSLVWIALTVSLQRYETGEPDHFISVIVDISAQKAAEAHRELLMGELAHRTKNQLAVVQAVASQTARGAGSLEEFRTVFEQRLRGMAASADLLIAQKWEGAPLGELVHRQLEAFGAGEGRLECDGPDVFLGSDATEAIGLALHELGTNCIKYGAWLVPGGTVRVVWSLGRDGAQPPELTVNWSERGGPAVAEPTRKGFGRLMIERIVAQKLHGSVEAVFDAKGLSWTLRVPPSQFTEAPLTVVMGSVR